MELIPVIDLLDGTVVRAQYGDRQRYAPVQSLLSDKNDPTRVTAAFLELYPFDTLYIADLNAIQNRGNHLERISRLQQTFPHLKLWLDSGISCTSSLQALLDTGIQIVIGTERLDSLEHYQALLSTCPHIVLSLDFKHQKLLAPNGFLEQRLWPERVIYMNLDRVGSYQGADISHAIALRAKLGITRLYVAGGVRNSLDLQLLHSTPEIQGILLASALHDGQITRTDIEQVLHTKITAIKKGKNSSF